MSTNHGEQLVLCTPRLLIPMDWLCQASTTRLQWGQLLHALSAIPLEWLFRESVETNEHYKQWIPYALLLNQDGKIATYPRQGQETRLHGVWSAGIGGHVHPADGDTWEIALLAGLKREILEETGDLGIGNPLFLGIINEESSDVGKVHIGAVFLQRFHSGVKNLSGELQGIKWVDPQEIGKSVPRSKFETWSLLSLELFFRSFSA